MPLEISGAELSFGSQGYAPFSEEPPLVLVADDEPLMLELVRHRLEMVGYRVVTAGDGGAAFETASQLKPDLIVLDYLMPVADGLETLRRLKQDSNLAEIPVLMISGVHDTHTLPALKLGVTDLLTKPFLLDELAVRVQRLVPVPLHHGT